MLVLAVRPVSAHGYIVRSIPEDRAELERAPTRVQYWFSEPLERQFSRIELLDNTGTVIASGGVDPEDDSLLVLRPPTDLPDGAYVVSLRPAFASDGHVVGETRVFFVGERVAGVEGSAASDAAVPLEVVWRGIVLTSTALLLGVFVLYDRVLLPAWGNKQYIAGFLPPRVLTRLTWIAGVALTVAIAGNVLAIFQNAMVLFDASLPRVVGSNLWNTARIGSRSGETWTVRMALLLILAALLALTIYWRDEKPRTIAPFWRALMWGTALMTGTFAVSSHAAGSLVMPWVGLLMHWLHLTAVSVWTGGLVALVLVMPVALRPYEGEKRRVALLAAMRRFSGVAVAALLVTVTSGIYNSLNWLFSPADVGTSYGMALVYKMLLFVGLLAVGAVHHIAARPERYAQWQALIERMGSWRVTLPLEAVFVVAVLISAGFVSSTPPPTPDFIESDVPAPRADAAADNLTAQMTISPGGPGVNTYDVRMVTETEAALVGTWRAAPDTVFVRMVQPSTDVRGEWLEAEAVEDALFVAAGDEIDTEGEWLTLVDVVTAEGESTRLAYQWNITNDASVLETIPPRWQHWLALAGVIAALCYAVAPAYRAFMQRMNLNALTVSVVLLGVVSTGVIIRGSFAYISYVQEQSGLGAAPPPDVINTVLPDADSLRAGADLYATNCVWERDSRDFEALVERLPRTRDAELYNFTREGFRGLPACNALQSETDRWHVVNFIRTFEPR
ncbi:MAG: CopD family protein [Chloroflexota bacterium]